MANMYHCFCIIPQENRFAFFIITDVEEHKKDFQTQGFTLLISLVHTSRSYIPCASPAHTPRCPAARRLAAPLVSSAWIFRAGGVIRVSACG